MKIIIVKTNFVGFHCWSDAPIEVDFLKNIHRHIFYVEVTLEIDGDRELEYFIVKRELNSIIVSLYKYDFNSEGALLGTMSCEDIAECIGKRMIKAGFRTLISVSVFEDNENGSKIIF